MKRARSLIRIIRPPQHYKALVVWLPALFHVHGALRSNFSTLLLVTLVWVCAASLIYVLNDLMDLKEDLDRPDRAQRPLVSGDLSPAQAWWIVAFLSLVLAGLLSMVAARLALFIGIYLALNLAYTMGLKKHLGLQQAIIAMGFWLRLKSGAAPLVPIPLTPWASLFTLGLAYYLSCIKGIHRHSANEHRPYRFAMGVGSALAGSLALASLVAICIKRSLDGTMNFPELPPLFCMVGMHRASIHSFCLDSAKEQSSGFFRDLITLSAMILFVASFLFW